MNKSIFAVILALPLAFCSCNTEQEFPDFDYQTIYFSTQTPVQTITLGEDGEFDVTMDNEHRFQIYATVGGVNTNKKERWADYVIDNTLVNGLTFEDGTAVKAMPAEYYTITSDPKRITIPKGTIMGAIDIKLNDAFFSDPEAVNTTYVIPVRLTNASDSILCGEAKEGVANPNILIDSDWSVLPKNYTLYCVKYKNRYAGAWLSRSTVSTNGGEPVVNQHEYWENEPIHYLTSKALGACNYTFSNAVEVTDETGALGEEVLTCNLVLTMDNHNANESSITITTDTPDCTASGTGTYKYHGAGNAWGTLERDKIELSFEYTINYVKNKKTGETDKITVKVTETLVSQTRQNKFETFNYVIE